MYGINYLMIVNMLVVLIKIMFTNRIDKYLVKAENMDRLHLE